MKQSKSAASAGSGVLWVGPEGVVDLKEKP